ncbi:hypothetical protein F4804DRAFT_349662 [Jackrogersella minutella]|nr:hypothetical protein F4804DRAFT_349662 [Jackrogersella minutella]
MPSSVTTSIPTGPIAEWCLVPESPRRSLFTPPCPSRSNATAPLEDFTSICCAGIIVDTAFDLYNSSNTITYPYAASDNNNNNNTQPVNLSDLLCCGVSGVQSQVLTPVPSVRTACAPGTAGTPLASLAATDASNASPYPVTWASASASAEATVTNDLWGWATPTYGASGTPVCLWANTAGGVGVVEVTVPATYVATSSSAAGSSSTAASSDAAARRGGGGLWRVLGLMVLGLLLI